MYVHAETRKRCDISEERIGWDDPDTQPVGKAETQTCLTGRALTFYIKGQSLTSCPSYKEAFKNTKTSGLSALKSPEEIFKTGLL